MEAIARTVHPSTRRTVCYIRLSSRKNKKELDRQRSMLFTACTARGIHDFEFLIDEDRGNPNASSTAFTQLMKSIEAGEIANVFTVSGFRCARSISHLVRYLEVMATHQTNFVAFDEDIDLESCGFGFLVAISWLSKVDRDIKRENVRRGMTIAKSKGRPIGRRRQRNDMLIQSLIHANLSLRAIAKIAGCSPSTVAAAKKTLSSRSH